MVLLDRIQSIGLVVHPDGRWEDRIGSFHPGTLNFAELCHRLQWMWNLKVAAALRHRKNFAGLDQVDAASTRAKLAKMPVEEQMLLRLSLAGGLFTQDAHAHWNETDGLCKWCGEADSLEHRYFACPDTAELRQKHAPLVVALKKQLPDAMALRSWAIQPPTHLAWLRVLDSVPVGVPSLSVQFRPKGWSYVFTDGSCLWQSVPSCRIAAWGAVLANACDATWSFTHGGILGSGCLPGLCQTSYRAELYAVGFVLHHAALRGCKVHLFCDCLGVVNRFHQLVSGCAVLKRNSASSDLWEWILASVNSLGRDNVRLVKTPAHKTIAQATTRREAWMFWNNQAADNVAKAANMSRPEEFWKFWKVHWQSVHAAKQLHDQVVALHVAVAKKSLKRDMETSLDDEHVPRVKEVRVFTMKFEVDRWQGGIPISFASEYGHGLTHRLKQWWCARTRSPAAGQVRWITIAHMYVDYQLCFGCPGPIRSGSVWLDALARPHLDPARYPFLQRLRWFRRFLKLFWKLTDQQVALETCKGEGEAIQSFVGAASVPWDALTWAGAEHWLHSELKTPCCRGSKPLEKLPPAKAQRRYALAEGAISPLGKYFA